MYVSVNKGIGTTTSDRVEPRVQTPDIDLGGAEPWRSGRETLIFKYLCATLTAALISR